MRRRFIPTVAKAGMALFFLLFLHLGSFAQLTVQVGTEDDQDFSIPLNSCNDYNYSQIIYTAEQMTDAGIPAEPVTISRIKFNIVSWPGEVSPWADWKIYMTNTTEAAFTEDYGWIDPAGFTMVFDGTISATGLGWFEIELTTPFVWNGTDNLAIAVSENTSGSWCTAGFEVSSVDEDQSMGYSTWEEEIDPLAPGEGEDWEVVRTSRIPNIRFTVTPTAECTGTATAGTISGPGSICALHSFSVVADGASLGEGIVAQWQSAPSATGPWTNIAGATTTDYNNSAGITAVTFYRYYTSCTESGTSDTSDAYEITLNPGTECYCEPVPTWGCGPVIDDFNTTGGINNIDNPGTGCGDDGYSDYTDQFISAYKGTIFNFEATTEMTWWTGWINIWVDWNQDGTFTDDERIYASDDIDAGAGISGSYEVPLTALTGETRMRVRILSAEDFEACGWEDWNGETEDYKFVVEDADPCEEVAASEVSITGPGSICSGYEFSIVSTGTPVASGITRTWQFRAPSGTGTWETLTGEDGLTYVAMAGITEATDYRYIITCEANGVTDTSDVITVEMNLPTECYCVPEYESGCEWGIAISHVILGDIDNNTDGECSLDPLGYSDYRDMSTDMMQGVSYTGQIASSGGSESGYAFWIDYNDDGFFDDATERAATVISIPWEISDELSDVTFDIPFDAPLGLHRMRVRMGAWVPGYELDPCEVMWDGETEDYSINIIPKPECTEVEFPSAAIAKILPAQLCGPGDVVLNLNTTMPIASGITYQWSRSATETGTFTAIAAPAASPVLAASVTADTWFKCDILCEGTVVLSTDAVEVPIVNPDLLETMPGASCGPGAVTLGAEGNEGSVIRWYADPEGGFPIAEGAEFTTPSLTSTTQYYVVAAAGGGPATDTLGAGSTTSSDWDIVSPFAHDAGGYKHQYLVRGSELSAMGVQPGNITSLAFMVTSGAGADFNDFSIRIMPTTVNAMTDAFVTGTFTDVFTSPTVTTTSGANVYSFTTPFNWDGLSNIIVQVCWSNEGEWGDWTNVRYHNTTFPAHFCGWSNDATADEVCTEPETGAWEVQYKRPNMIFGSFSGCETEREPVLASVNPVPLKPFVATDTTACGDRNQTISLNAANPGASYLWSDGSTGQSLTIFESGNYWVTVTNEFDCSVTDEIFVNLLPTPVVNLGNDTTFCDGGVVKLDAGNAGSLHYWNTGEETQSIEVGTEGAYRVLVTNSFGCMAGDTINVSISGIIPSIDEIIVDNIGAYSFQFTPLNPENVGTFTWDFGDGEPTSNVEAPSHNYDAAGNYEVTLTLESECGKFVYKTTVSIVGVNNIDLGNDKLVLYPNPATETALIENKSDLPMQEITVMNVLGQVMTQEKADNAKTHRLNLSNYASGIYTVRILTDKGFVVRKFEVIK